MIRLGNASPPWETKYAGPVNGTGITGVVAVACPTIDAAGHPAGLASNVASGQAFWSVVRREGSFLGSSTLTREMFASYGPAGYASFTCRLAPSAREVFPDTVAVSFGLNARTAQLVAWNGTESPAEDPSLLPR